MGMCRTPKPANVSSAAAVAAPATDANGLTSDQQTLLGQIAQKQEEAQAQQILQQLQSNPEALMQLQQLQQQYTALGLDVSDPVTLIRLLQQAGQMSETPTDVRSSPY